MKINTGHLPLPESAASRGLLPVRSEPTPPPAERRESQRPLPVRSLEPELKGVLEARARRFAQGDADPLADNPKSRQAIQAYQALSRSDEREQVSQMLGVDEYA